MYCRSQAHYSKNQNHTLYAIVPDIILSNSNMRNIIETIKSAKVFYLFDSKHEAEKYAKISAKSNSYKKFNRLFFSWEIYDFHHIFLHVTLKNPDFRPAPETVEVGTGEYFWTRQGKIEKKTSFSTVNIKPEDVLIKSIYFKNKKMPFAPESEIELESQPDRSRGCTIL